jgi:hypothetical protein
VYRGALWCNLGVYNSLTAFVGNTEQKCRHIRGLVSQLIPAWAPPEDAEWTIEDCDRTQQLRSMDCGIYVAANAVRVSTSGSFATTIDMSYSSLEGIISRIVD